MQNKERRKTEMKGWKGEMDTVDEGGTERRKDGWRRSRWKSQRGGEERPGRRDERREVRVMNDF